MSQRQRQTAMILHDHIRRLSLRRPLDNRDSFDDEMDELRKVDHRVRSNLDEFYTASLGTNIVKNRFPEVRANEGSLVRCASLNEDGGSTYINANYVDGRALFGVPFTYIATQSPLPNTIFDFWRMICKNKVFFIVMLCGEVENGKVKSEVYWPRKGERLDFGFLRVQTVSECRLFDLVFRTFAVHTAGGEEWRVQHLQYLGWPDQSIPNSSASLMEIIQTLGESERGAQAPIVVHCSGGIGRTGVFIALHVVLAQFQLERDNIDVQRVVHTLRLCRSGMVQRKDQYVFLNYSVLREMDRMILSAEKGVNLLKLRRRESAPKSVPPPVPDFSQFNANLYQPPPPDVVGPRPVKKSGVTSGVNVPYVPSTPNGITEAEQELLENYLRRQIASASISSSRGAVLSRCDPPLRSSMQASKEVTVEQDGGGGDAAAPSKGDGDVRMYPSRRDASALEEQLRHWQIRNRRMRFSTFDGKGEETLPATERNHAHSHDRDYYHNHNHHHHHHHQQQQQQRMGTEMRQEAAATGGATLERSVAPVSIIVSPMEMAPRSTNPDPLTQMGSTPRFSTPQTTMGDDEAAARGRVAPMQEDVSPSVCPPQRPLTTEEYERL